MPAGKRWEGIHHNTRDGMGEFAADATRMAKTKAMLQGIKSCSKMGVKAEHLFNSTGVSNAFPLTKDGAQAC